LRLAFSFFSRRDKTMSQILVTGANGFVGRGLCDALRTRGIAVVPAVRKINQASDVAVGDLSAATDWRLALQNCDAVIHLAGTCTCHE